MAFRVLLVDDLPFIRKALRDIFEKEGFAVCGEAADGREAVRLYDELGPDLVVLDITMPVMDGLEALRRIVRRHPSAAVVMCSALDQERTTIRAVRLGARDFVVKPFKAERILSAARKALQSVS